jgi:hypothetical protein
MPPHFNPDVYKLDLTTFVWSAVNCAGMPPLPRDFHTATAIGDCMFVFGGRSGTFSPGGFLSTGDQLIAIN